MYTLWEGILRMSLGGGIAIAAVLAARLLLRRAPRRLTALLWLAVLFRLLCPVSLPAPVGLLPQQEAAPFGRVAAGGQAPAAQAAAGAVDVQKPAQAQAQAGPAPTPVQTTEAVQPFQWRSLLPWLWLAGAVGLLAAGLLSSLSLGRRLRGAVPVEGHVYEAPVAAPFVCGLLRPRIYLPPGLCEPGRSHILAHERAHIRRGDHIVKPVAYLALCLHWFNPLVWLFFHLFERDLEMACDEQVVSGLGAEGKQQYSRSLLALASGQGAPGGPLHFSEGNASARIRRVLWYKRPKVWLLAAALVAVAALGVFLCLDRARPAVGDEQVLALAAQVLEPGEPGEYADLQLGGVGYRVKPLAAAGAAPHSVQLGDTVTKRPIGDQGYTVPLLGADAQPLGVELLLALDGKGEPGVSQASLVLGDTVITGRQGELTFLDPNTGMILRLPARWKEEAQWYRRAIDPDISSVLYVQSPFAGEDGQPLVVLDVQAGSAATPLDFGAGSNLGRNEKIRVGCSWSGAIQRPEECPAASRPQAQQYRDELDGVVQQLIRDNDLTPDDSFDPAAFGLPDGSGVQGPAYSADYVRCPIGQAMVLNQGQWDPRTEIYYAIAPKVVFQITDSTGVHDFSQQVDELLYDYLSEDYYLLVPLQDETGATVWSIVLMVDGPSSDPGAYFFQYQSGALQFLGGIPTDVHDVESAFPGDGRIHGRYRLDILQTWYAPAQWELRGGTIQQVEQPLYDTNWTGGADFPCRLLEPLPIYRQRGDAQPYMEMAPQLVEFPATDNRQWVQVRGADGTEGWFRVEDFMELPDLGKSAMQVFENLFLAD